MFGVGTSVSCFLLRNSHLKCGKGADAIAEADISSSASTANGKRVWGIATN